MCTKLFILFEASGSIGNAILIRNKHSMADIPLLGREHYTCMHTSVATIHS